MVRYLRSHGWLQVVSLHCALDEKSKHLMNKERLEMMKPDAILINAARGPVHDEAALVAHLQSHPDFRCAFQSAPEATCSPSFRDQAHPDFRLALDCVPDHICPCWSLHERARGQGAQEMAENAWCRCVNRAQVCSLGPPAR